MEYKLDRNQLAKSDSFKYDSENPKQKRMINHMWNKSLDLESGRIRVSPRRSDASGSLDINSNKQNKKVPKKANKNNTKTKKSEKSKSSRNFLMKSKKRERKDSINYDTLPFITAASVTSSTASTAKLPDYRRMSLSRSYETQTVELSLDDEFNDNVSVGELPVTRIEEEKRVIPRAHRRQLMPDRPLSHSRPSLLLSSTNLSTGPVRDLSTVSAVRTATGTFSKNPLYTEIG